MARQVPKQAHQGSKRFHFPFQFLDARSQLPGALHLLGQVRLLRPRLGLFQKSRYQTRERLLRKLPDPKGRHPQPLRHLRTTRLTQPELQDRYPGPMGLALLLLARGAPQRSYRHRRTLRQDEARLPPTAPARFLLLLLY